MQTITIEIFENSISVEVPHEVSEDIAGPDSVERALIALGFEQAFHTSTADIGDGTLIYHYTTA